MARRPASKPTFNLRGGALASSAAPVLPLGVLKDRATVLADFRPGASRAAGSEQTLTVAPDHILEIELEDGQRLWISGHDYCERYATAVSRDSSGQDIAIVPTQLQILPRALQTRGPVSWVVKSLKVIGLDLAGHTALALAKLVDNRIAPGKRPGLGLYQCRSESGGFALFAARKQELRKDQPNLLFVHGPGSSTWGSFGDLWSAERGAELHALRGAYANAVLAFEHASLTASPIRNTLDLLEGLPRGARLHLVTHSRGGLVGELLCRARNNQGSPFSSKEIEIYKRALEARSDELEIKLNIAEQVAELRELSRKLGELQPVVERFIRVGCPALGTTLASGRLDRWLSVIGNICGMALPGTPLADWFADIADFMAAVVAKRTNPATLPGLEAMMPDSGLIRILNFPGAEVDGDLTVVAGDIDPDAWWARLLVWATDRFYEGDHDLVVNTPSMFGGAKRTGAGLVSLHKGGSVNHFNYFSNKPSAEAVVRGLLQPPGSTAGFELLEQPAVEIARGVPLDNATPLPVVFVLPGIMGTELMSGRDRIWLRIAGLMFGGFKRLAIEKAVDPFRPVPKYYAGLINFLGNSHRTIPFPFDWRQPIEKEADRLALLVQAELNAASKARQPVSLLAHSMGGLVARAMIARHPELWQQMCQHANSRLIMLGTPNGGSHAVTELLIGESSILKSLAAVDLTQSKLDLLKLISRFPGVLAMLPKDSRENYFSPQTWAGYFQKAGKGWVLPEAKTLDGARRFRDLIDRAPLDPRHMIYVAGCAEMTATAMEFDAKGKEIRFLGTARGDGRVTWESGIPAGIPTWYMDVEHGDLCANSADFPALKELLETGATTRLPQAPKVPRGLEEVFPMPRQVLELYPTDELLVAAVLGARPRKRIAPKEVKLPLQLRIVHGNLAYSKYPIAVGHYSNDAIVSAEKYLDSVLGGQLSQRQLLGLYPGAVGTSAIFINRSGKSLSAVRHPGAIIVGLGTPGQLTAGALSRTFSRALLEYVLEGDKDLPDLSSGQNLGGPKAVGVAALLIGSGAGGVTVSDCVYALLTGASLANVALEQARQTTRIGKLDLFELWEDRAIQAAEALQELTHRQELADKFTSNLLLERTEGGLRRIRYEEPADWWHRLQILGGGKEGEPGDGTLRFASSTRRARSEVRLQRTQRAIVDNFIERAIRQTTDDPAVAGTLFELLLPNEIKDQAPDRGNIVLLVDEDAARYPWELLRDPARPGTPPISVEQGMLRQLESYEFSEGVRPVFENTALVIGDPESSFPELPGARKEAETVWQALRSRGRFLVEKRIRPAAHEVMIALYAKPYRILHLAGHGVYRYPRPAATKGDERVTGMVIGDNAFLTPAELSNMRQVPELVFINCCHLGRIEDTTTPTEYNKLAANIATEFIRRGVRAVVAAGWAVDDDAASVFARTFYEQMLGGASFGRAVHRARIETHAQFPQSNTCGAYQCYGDPDWKLLREEGDLQASLPLVKFTTPMQAVVDLQNLVAELKTKALAPESGQQRLKALVERLDKSSLLEDPLVLAPLGRAWGEAEMFTDAVRVLRVALSTEKANASMSDIELLANLEARDAMRLAREGQPDRALEEIATAIRRLEAITAIATVTTVERLALLGSAYKRMAWLTADAKVRAGALEKSRDFYSQAYTRKKDIYPFLNLLTAEIVLNWQRRGTPPKDILRLVSEDLPGNQATLRTAIDSDRGFWNSTMLADLDLLQSLAIGGLKEELLENLATGYLAAAERGSPREFASVLDQLDFIAAMAEKQKPEVFRLLRALRRRLAKEPEAKARSPKRTLKKS